MFVLCVLTAIKVSVLANSMGNEGVMNGLFSSQSRSYLKRIQCNQNNRSNRLTDEPKHSKSKNTTSEQHENTHPNVYTKQRKQFAINLANHRLLFDRQQMDRKSCMHHTKREGHRNGRDVPFKGQL